jgi:hypothetical protein
VNIQTIDIENNGPDLFEVGPISIPAGESLRLFDLSDLSTYDRALWAMCYGIDPIFYASESGAISVSLNGSILEAASWASFKDWIAVLFAGQMIGFHGTPFCFDMKNKTFKVRDPLSGDLYAVQLFKVP